MMKKLGLFSYQHRKLILICWLLLVMIAGFFAVKLPSILGGSGFEMEGSYKEVKTLMEDHFDIPESSLIVLFEKKQHVNDEAFQTYIEETLERIAKIDEVEAITSPLDEQENKKGNYAYAVVSFSKPAHEMKQETANMRQALVNKQDMSVGLTGAPLIEEDMSEASQNDLFRAEMIGLPVALIVLLLAFRGIIAALVPLVTGLVSVAAAMGLLYLTGQHLELSIFVLNTVPMIGLALGIDFALLFVNRFREELENQTTEQAIVKTVATSGRAIVFSGLCVLLGLTGMLFIQVGVFQAIAIGGIAVVLTSVLAANTFLPALLSLLGPHINKWILLKETKKKANKWHAFAAFVMKHPMIMAVTATVVLIIGLLPIADIKLTIPEADALPASYESRTVYETFEKNFLEENATAIPMIVKANENMLDLSSLKKLENLTETLKKEKLVTKVDSVLTISGLNAEVFHTMYENEEQRKALQELVDKTIHKEETLLTVTIAADASSKAAKDWVRNWKDKETDLQILVGGKATFHQEVFDEIYQKALYSLGFIFLSTYIVLFFAFHSVLIPLKAIFMNILSLGATFGIIVWLFQGGHLGNGASDIALMIPVFAFSIVFGLSMDYEVFLISRIHEVYKETGDNNRATLEGLTSTSKIITSAAAIMIVITGAFAFTGVVPVKQMGVAVALAIFIDATIVRMVLVPSLMKLLGNLNWWAPKILRRRVKKRARGY